MLHNEDMQNVIITVNLGIKWGNPTSLADAIAVSET